MSTHSPISFASGLTDETNASCRKFATRSPSGKITPEPIMRTSTPIRSLSWVDTNPTANQTMAPAIGKETERLADCSKSFL